MPGEMFAHAWEALEAAGYRRADYASITDAINAALGRLVDTTTALERHDDLVDALMAIAAARQEAEDWDHLYFDWRLLARKMESIARAALAAVAPAPPTPTDGQRYLDDATGRVMEWDAQAEAFRPVAPLPAAPKEDK